MQRLFGKRGRAWLCPLGCQVVGGPAAAGPEGLGPGGLGVPHGPGSVLVGLEGGHRVMLGPAVILAPQGRKLVGRRGPTGIRLRDVAVSLPEGLKSLPNSAGGNPGEQLFIRGPSEVQALHPVADANRVFPVCSVPFLQSVGI